MNYTNGVTVLTGCNYVLGLAGILHTYSLPRLFCMNMLHDHLYPERSPSLASTAGSTGAPNATAAPRLCGVLGCCCLLCGALGAHANQAGIHALRAQGVVCLLGLRETMGTMLRTADHMRHRFLICKLNMPTICQSDPCTQPSPFTTHMEKGNAWCLRCPFPSF